MGVLLMLMTIGGLITAIVLLGISVFTKRIWLGKFVFGAVAVWLVFYAILLFATALSSRENTLGLNEPKEFCGFYLDCHLHTAVTDVRKMKMLGSKIASGEFYVVKVKVFSDAKRSTLGLITVDTLVFDDQNSIFTRDLEAESFALGRNYRFGFRYYAQIYGSRHEFRLLHPQKRPDFQS